MSRKRPVQAMDNATRAIEANPPTLTSNNLDIVTLIENASTAVGGDLIKWLSWERISPEAFLWALRLGQNLANPNEHGLKIVNELETTASRLYGLQLILPGSLGRTIAYDEQLRWIGTTEAVILKHHGAAYAVEAFCELFARSQYKKGDQRIPALKARIRPVLSKMVDSLHLHTVNMGHGIRPLPDILEALPKHYLAETWLAEVILPLGKAERDVIVELNCYIPEIVEWIFHHWSGKLKIALNNKLVYDEQLGELESNALIVIENSCPASGDCQDISHVRHFKISLRAESSSQFEEHAAMPDSSKLRDDDGTRYRSELYSFRNPFRTRNLYLSLKEEKDSERIAQEIVRQIVDLRVTPIREVAGLRVEGSSTTTFRWWLKKTPTILQKNLRAEESKSTISFADHKRKKPGTASEGEIVYTPYQVAKWYPDIYDMMKKVHARCACGCWDNDENKSDQEGSDRDGNDRNGGNRNGGDRNRDDPEQGDPSGFQKYLRAGQLDTGCLVGMALTEILLYIAHAMGEGGGAKDVSNLDGRETAIMLSRATLQFLGALADKRHILWDNWFRLVSSMITGIPYDTANEKKSDDGGGLVLWAAGPRTIAPRWLFLGNEIQLSGSWAVEQHFGSVLGLPAEIAVVESQRSATATYAELPDFVEVETHHDSEKIQIESAVFSSDLNLYRLVTIAQTSDVVRIMNPLDAYRGAMLAKRYNCPHNLPNICHVRPWGISHILLGWNTDKAPDGTGPHIAFLDDDNAKQNVALAYSIGNCIIQDGDCCLDCMSRHALRRGWVGIIRTMNAANKAVQFK